jgi:alpha-glucosidase (family GH31 glycosyl hydrolase)
MKNIINKSILITLAFYSSCIFAQAQNNPVANPASVINYGKARFTVLTNGLIRMEWDSLGVFEDNATQVVINRNLSKPNFTVKQTESKWTIATEKLQLVYKKSDKRFDASNLQIEVFNGKIRTKWNLETTDNANLKGTCRTLDSYNGDVAEWGKKEKLQLEEGLLSKSGWHLLDDSKSYLLDNSSLPWVKERRSYTSQDLYFFAYNTDYKSAIYDYTLIAGKVPLPPRYTFGYWWSRYYTYSDQELRNLVGKFDRYKIPLDVLVIDMDWHPTEKLYVDGWVKAKTDLSGSRRGWGGYTWDRTIFPNPEGFLKWTAEKQLKITLNLHPASGIPYIDEKYSEFAKILNFDTTGVTQRELEKNNPNIKKTTFDDIGYKDIPYEGTDKKFMNTLFDLVLHPLENQGVDFWWLDWQQYPHSKLFPKLSNVWWLNHLFFHQMQLQQKARPMIYHRWGGMGNHRYQIGFSGDASITWKSLAFQPYFTATASNVLYGYWSHDIGGHIGTKDTTEAQGQNVSPELYTRWLQYGVFSPILRTHSVRGLPLNREPWEFATKYGEIIADYINLRYSLAPYIYTMARKTYDTGISLCRPLYYDYPNENESYNQKSEYMFGDELLVAQIGEPSVNDVSTKKVWLPKGSWIELASGTRFTGSQTIERRFALDEYPVYIKEGAIIPSNPKLNNLKHNCDTVILKVYGKANTESSLYEDAGDDDSYKKDQFRTTIISAESKLANTQTITISPAKGSFAGMSSTKTYFVQLHGQQLPSQVKVNGETIAFSANSNSQKTWRYLGDKLAVEVAIPMVNVNSNTVIELTYPQNNLDMNGLLGKMKRAEKAFSFLKEKTKLTLIPKEISKASELNLNIEYAPTDFAALVTEFLATFNNLETWVNAMELDKKQKEQVLDILK